MLVTNSLPVNLQPFFLLVLGSLSIGNQDVITAMGENVNLYLVALNRKKNLKTKKSGKDVVIPTYHLESHHLVDNVWNEHLNVSTVLLNQLLLKISQWKTKIIIEGHQVNTKLPKRK